MAHRAALFIDGRYTVQARMQAPAELFEFLHLNEDPHVQWLADSCPQAPGSVSMPACTQPGLVSERQRRAGRSRHRAGAHRREPHRSALERSSRPTKSPVILYSEELAGQSSQAKREMLASDLRKRGLDAVLLTQAEPINWLLNLRGRDVERLPVVLGFAVLYANTTMDFFVDTDKIDCFAFSQHVGQDVSVHPIDKLGDVLQRIGEISRRCWPTPTPPTPGPSS